MRMLPLLILVAAIAGCENMKLGGGNSPLGLSGFRLDLSELGNPEFEAYIRKTVTEDSESRYELRLYDTQLVTRTTGYGRSNDTSDPELGRPLLSLIQLRMYITLSRDGEELLTTEIWGVENIGINPFRPQVSAAQRAITSEWLWNRTLNNIGSRIRKFL